MAKNQLKIMYRKQKKIEVITRITEMTAELDGFTKSRRVCNSAVFISMKTAYGFLII